MLGNLARSPCSAIPAVELDAITPHPHVPNSFHSFNFQLPTSRLLHVSSQRRDEQQQQPSTAARIVRSMLPAASLSFLPVALAEGAAGTAGTTLTAAGYAISPGMLTLLSTAGPACFLFLQLSGSV